MSEVSERWHDVRYNGSGYYLVNDPEITFQDEAEAGDYCDEHNRALVGQAALEERAAIVAWLRKEAIFSTDSVRRRMNEALDQVEAGEHLK